MNKHSIAGIDAAIDEISNLPKPTINTNAALSKFKNSIKFALQQGHKLPVLLSIINKHQKKYNGDEFTLEQLNEHVNSTTTKKKNKSVPLE